MNYGIKVSQLGFDTDDATAQQLIFSSKYNTLKIHSQGYGTANPDVAGDVVTVTIAHGLSYIPAFTVFTEIDDVVGDDGQFFLAPFTYPVGGDASIIAWSDSTNINIRFGADLDGPSALKAVDYKYIIYKNEGSN